MAQRIVEALQRHRQVVKGLKRLEETQRVGQEIALAQMEPTQNLAERIRGLRTRLAQDPAHFDYADFALQAKILPPILRARKASGDSHADFAARELSELEPAILQLPA